MPKNAALKLAIYISDRSQADIGEDCGFSEKQMSNIVHGRRRVKSEEQQRIAETLGVDRSKIFPA